MDEFLYKEIKDRDYIDKEEQELYDLDLFLKNVRKYTDPETLTAEMVNELIDKIVVHAPDKSSGHRTQEIEIHYRFNVAVATAVADSMKYDKKRKAA